MKIAICDDDPQCLQQAAELLSEYARGKNISVSAFSHGAALMEESRLLGGFDLYILDILMPGLNGIQLGTHLRRAGFSGNILYLTSSQDYAIDAFRVRACSYLLKPVRRETLYPILDEVLAAAAVRKEKCILVKTAASSLRLDFDSILYAELVKKTIVYHLVGGRNVETLSIRSTFSEATQELQQDSRFALCGSSKLVNLHYVAELDAENLIFKNRSTLYIGRRACRELRSVWFDFWFSGRDEYDTHS